MTKNVKAKERQRPQLDRRIMAGALVGLIVVVVVIAKLTDRKATAVSVGSGPVLGSTYGPALPEATAIPQGDPYPSSPAAQVQWVYRNSRPAMLLYHSTNCIPCKAMEKLVAQVRADYEPDVTFVDIITNDSANSTEVRRSGIRYIPTSFFVSSSGTSEQFVGAMEEDALRAKLESLKAGK